MKIREALNKVACGVGEHIHWGENLFVKYTLSDNPEEPVMNIRTKRTYKESQAYRDGWRIS